MLAERYLRRRFEEGKKEGYEEGNEEGKALGRALARRRTLKYVEKLQAWVQEGVEAAEKGEPFDKPMPEYDDEDDE